MESTPKKTQLPHNRGDVHVRGAYLTDTDIRREVERKDGLIRIHNFSESQLTPAGYDLRAGDMIYSTKKRRIISLDHNSFEVRPGDTVFISTYESLDISSSVAGITTSRLGPQLDGLLTTALTIDPTWRGNLLIVMTNLSKKPVTIRHRERLLTASFFYVASDSSLTVSRERWNNDNVRELFRKYENEARRIRNNQLLVDISVVVGTVVVGCALLLLGWLTTSVEVVTSFLAVMAIYFASIREKLLT